MKLFVDTRTAALNCIDGIPIKDPTLRRSYARFNLEELCAIFYASTGYPLRVSELNTAIRCVHFLGLLKLGITKGESYAMPGE